MFLFMNIILIRIATVRFYCSILGSIVTYYCLRIHIAKSAMRTFFAIFFTYSLYIGIRLPYREFAGNALIECFID
jgi:hypothetical protein